MNVTAKLTLFAELSLQDQPFLCLLSFSTLRRFEETGRDGQTDIRLLHRTRVTAVENSTGSFIIS
jgi:hypothetical protein